MFLGKKLCFFFSVTCFLALAESEEVLCSVNGVRVLNKVSDKFLSVSIDPAILFNGLNLSEASLLAKYLSPAYVRLAGPSTRLVRYQDQSFYSDTEQVKNGVITPSIWLGVNQWFDSTDLTPVFGISDVDVKSDGSWDPTPTLPLFDVTNELGFDCHWQLGYDCGNKSEHYVDNLMVMSETLKRYPARSWKIVGSDASACLAEGNAPLRKKKYNFDDVIAIMWEPTSPNDSDGFAGLRTLGASKRIALWTSAPPSTEKVTFDSAMDWASRVGKAAKNGYQVIYRQLTTQELAYSDTPVYWFTVLHKRLMGNHVLEVKSRAGPALSIYCHCAKRQDEFARSGAVTIMAINNGTEDIDLHVVLGTIFAEKSMEVQTYTLTAAADAPTVTYLNGNRLVLHSPDDVNPLKPVVRRAKTPNHVSVELPATSISFHVLAGARMPPCVQHENEIDSELTTTDRGRAKLRARTPTRVETRFKAFQIAQPARSTFRLTVEEVEDVLKRRAQAKAAERRVKLTDAELDALVRKATITLPRKVEIKRDINRALLEEKASFYRYNTFSQEALERLGNAGKSGRLPRDFKVKRDINLDLLKRRSGNRDLADPFKVKRRTTTTTKPAPSRWFDSDDLDVDSEVGSSPDDLFAELLETSSVDEEVQVPKRRPIAKKIVSDESGDGRLQYLSASGELGPCIGQFFGKQPCSSIFDYARRKRDRPENALDAGIKSTRYDGPFGRYEPISARFRPWRPADILYLKRDFNTFPLTNGKFKGGRRWERDVDSAENEIDHGTDHRNYIVKVPAGGAHHVQKVGAAGRRASFEGVIGTIFREIWSKLAELVSKLW